jgi:hypothetical protein
VAPRQLSFAPVIEESGTFLEQERTPFFVIRTAGGANTEKAVRLAAGAQAR